MDDSVMGGGLLSGSSRILEFDPSIHRHQQQTHLPQQPLSHHHQIQAMNAMTRLESDHHAVGLMEAKVSSCAKANSMSYGKGKGITHSAITTTATAMNNDDDNNTSEEDEPSFNEDGSADAQFGGGRTKKGSPWQRMKWTDSIVRLLITVVACVGDDVTPEVGDGPKRKSGVMQKKGKWKTVSNLMMKKGCFVSPQQCEDKFNDLNKRYKRLNEILGRGTTCRVVENPVLLDSMTHLSAKLKDDVRKILSSKHLFYKEMCAYHNGQRIPNSNELDQQGYSLPIMRCSKDGSGFGEEEDEGNHDCNDDDLDNEDENTADEDAKRMGEFGKRKKVTEEDSTFWSQSSGQDGFRAGLGGMLQDTTKSSWELLEWIKNRTLQLQEQRVSLQAQAFELEKRCFKWQRFCSKKDRDLERLRLENERMRLENERMTLQLKQGELEFDFNRPEASLDPVSLGMDSLQGRDQSELGDVR